MTEALRVLHEDIESRVCRIASDGWPCRKGCDRCCRSLHRQPVLTQPEWRLLEGTLTPDLRSRILAADGKVCPLLDEVSGECKVYAVRPVACRTYGFYADREGGLYCSEIAQMANLSEIVWGNAEAVERRLETMGERQDMREWLLRSQTAANFAARDSRLEAQEQ